MIGHSSVPLYQALYSTLSWVSDSFRFVTRPFWAGFRKSLVAEVARPSGPVDPRAGAEHKNDHAGSPVIAAAGGASSDVYVPCRFGAAV